jgi:hypothetical protein
MAHRKHKVKAGECIASIAFKYGFFPESIWNDPKNRELKDKRKDPNVLLAGDTVYVRDKEAKEESCAAEQRHRFKRKGVPEKLRLQFLLADGSPRKDEPYELDVDGNLLSGRTDGQGRIEQSIPPNAQRAVVLLGAAQEEFAFALGGLDPIEEVRGVQGRLLNLGYYNGSVDGELGEATRAAISAFQRGAGIKASGEVDKKTRDALKKKYGG